MAAPALCKVPPNNKIMYTVQITDYLVPRTRAAIGCYRGIGYIVGASFWEVGRDVEDPFSVHRAMNLPSTSRPELPDNRAVISQSIIHSINL